jgi:hypothetical protein
MADKIYTVHNGEIELTEVGGRVDADAQFKRPDEDDSEQD